MKAIIVDDEQLMLKKFERIASYFYDLMIVGKFESADDAIAFAENEIVDVAFVDIDMPIKNGIELARELREIRSDMIIVFVTAYDEYIADSNQIGGDYYLMKPYDRETFGIMMEKIRILASRQSKDVYAQLFGRFVLKKNGIPIKLTGKAKEILALVITKRGKEISNEEIYTTIWENRPYSNEHMSVYYNALRRLKESLKEAELEDILISTRRGQMINVECFECDYYAWRDKNTKLRDQFEGEFLSEYSWGEGILANIIMEGYGR